MSEEIKKFTKLFSAYGRHTQKVIKSLYLNTERTFSQLLLTTKLTKLDLTLAISLLLQTRHIKFKKRNSKNVFILTEPKIMFYPFYSDYVYKNLKSSYNLFIKILTNGVVNSKRIKSKTELDCLVINKLVKVVDAYQVKCLYKEEDNVSEQKKLREETKNYIYVDYDEIEKKIVYDFYTLVLINKYNLVAGKLFRSIVSNKSTNLSDIIKNIGKVNENEVDISLEYLENDKLVCRNKFDVLTIQPYWLEDLKLELITRYLISNFDLNTLRIFLILLKKEVYDSNASKTFLLANTNMRKSLLNLQLIGFVNIIGEFSANTFYNKSNLKWKSNKEFSMLFYKNFLFKEIIFNKESFEQRIIEFMIFSLEK